MRTMILAALAASALLFGALPAEAGDWRRQHHHGSGITLGPGISLQIITPGPRHFHAPPRYSHDTRRYWHRQNRHWHGPRHYQAGPPRFAPGRHYGNHRGHHKRHGHH